MFHKGSPTAESRPPVCVQILESRHLDTFYRHVELDFLLTSSTLLIRSLRLFSGAIILTMAGHRVLDDYYLAMTLLVTVAYQLIGFSIAFTCKFDKLTGKLKSAPREVALLCE